MTEWKEADGTMCAKRYDRLTKADRRAIEAGLRERKGCREIASSINRSPSTVSEEVRRNRTWMARERRGMAAGEVPQGTCAHLERWPWTCNGCSSYMRKCGRQHRCEYAAIYAQRLADERLVEARRGTSAREEDFERIAFSIRPELARGLSPEQICLAHPELGLAPSTLYRWVERGYFGMSNMDLRRKVGYKRRASRAEPKATSHGPERSYAAFCALDEGLRARACEMDTVIGRARDAKCLLTLYLRPCKAQLALLLEGKEADAVASALDGLERALGAGIFSRLLGTILTDNGPEFSDAGAIERSALGDAPRCRAFYCDVRASQQKGACERNHVELRKLLPKGRGISFDGLEPRDCAVLMSHLNSQPRPSLMGLSPLALLRAAEPEAAEALMDALGIEEVPYGRLDMTLGAINADRARRGAAPLA